MTRTAPSPRGVLSVAAAALCLVLSGCAVPGQDEAGVLAAPGLTVAAPSASAELASPRLDHVPVAPPERLVFPAAGIDGPVEEYTAAEAEAEGGINPATLDTISWYSGIRDPMPGSDAANTVYLFGHSWVEPAVFNGLTGVHAGDRATVTTATGDLVYEVDEIITMAKPDFTQDPRVVAVVPGRLALVTCHRPDGWDPSASAPDNTVVFLHLVEARSAD
ncbi:class F sortase [Microbacterium sp. NPDC019599]|uniref:class F sortase n=1 Tax=Microbacterium sp. NPDC019599 TaxID=3154690 RepID=UPI0033CD520D